MEFSIVIPIASNELKLIQRNLPSWCMLKPSELLLCFDKPAPEECLKTARSIAEEHGCKERLRILEVEPNPKYAFHQAWVRRKGFLEAKYDVILTGDIDLYVFPSCLKALELVGRENVGLVSLSKLRRRQGFIGQLRNIIDHTTRLFAKRFGKEKSGQAYFTGLYCIWRPFWLDSEPEESIMLLRNPKKAPPIKTAWGFYLGEDTHLRDWMIRKHRCLYLADIGAIDTRLGLEDTKIIQFRIGQSFAYKKHPLGVLLHALIHVRPYVIVGYLHQMLHD